MKDHTEIKIKKGFASPWLLAVILFGLILFTIVLGAYYSKIESNKIKIKEQNILAAVVDLKVKQIINWRKERKSDALIIENNSSAAEFVADYFNNKVKKEEINRWIKSFCETNGYSSATIFDQKNKIRFSYGFRGDTIDQLGYELLREMYEKKSYFLSDLYFSQATKTVTINLFVPLIYWEQKNHPVIGAILFRIDPYKVLYPLIQSWPSPSLSSETILLGREGNEVVFLNELRFRKGTALKLKYSINNNDRLPAARAARGFEGVFEGIDYRGIDVLSVTRSIPDSPWFIVGKVDRSEIYEPLYDQMREYKIILSLLILVMAIALGFWWRHQRAIFYREKYHSELVLKESELKYRNLYNNTPVMLHSIDKEGKLLSVSDYWLKAMGYKRNEVLGRKSTDFLSHKSKQYAAEKVIPEFMQTGYCDNIEYQFVRKNGEIIDTLLSAVSERDESGQLIRSLAVITDITSHKLAEKEISLLAHAMKSINECVSITDMEDNILFVNQSFLDTFGYTSKELLGQHMNLVRSPNNPAGIINSILPATLKGGWEGELLNRKKDGSDFPISLSTSIVYDQFGHPISLIGVATDITERKKAENAIIEREEWFKTLFEQTSDGIFFLNLNGEVITVNESFATMHGYSVEEIMKMKLGDLDTPESNKPFPERIARLLAGENLLFEVEHYHKDGFTFPLEVTASSITVGEEKFILASHRNITERKRVQEALRQSEIYLRGILDSTDDGILAVDNNGKIINTNNRFSEMWNIPKELINQKDDNILLDYVLNQLNDPDTFIAKVKDLYNSERTDFGTLYFKDHRIFERYSTPLVLDEKIVGRVWSFRDITERKHAEDLLRNSEIRFSAIFHNSPIGMYLTKFPDGKLKDVNQAFLNLLGFTREQIVGKLTTEINIWIDLELRNRLAKELREKGTIKNVINQFRRKSGEIVDVEMSIEMIELEGEPFDLTVIQDITKRRQAEEAINTLNSELEQRVKERTARLEAANKELEAFSYSVSHDLRSPLRAIDGFSEILLENYSNVVDDQGKDYLNRVRAATQRMAELIDNLLNLSRISRTELNFQQVNLTSIANVIVQELINIEPGRNINIQIKPEVVAKGDAALLRYILDNLLGNAWKFTSKCEKAIIEFGSKEINGKQTYFVNDNGAGFDMAYYDKLFGAFQRLHSVSDFPGTGVGLATVQRIVHLHGGKVWAEGIPGKGATFYFTLS
jgi:PAS domain S-box-containing protein